MKRYLAYITLLMMLVLQSHAWAAPEADTVAPESPGISAKKIARGVEAGPGNVAWSPGGERLAYISGRLYISSPDGSGRVKSPVKGVFFVSWPQKDRLLALGVRGGVAHAYLLDPEGKKVSESLLPFAPEAAYDARGDFSTLLLTREIREEMSIGLRTRSELHVLDVASGESREVFSAGRIHPRAMKGKGFVMGWSGAGPSPLDGMMALIEYYDPPAVNPYTIVSLVDYATGRSMRIYRSPFGRLLDGAGWSAGGSILAIVDHEGGLRLLGRHGTAHMPDETIKGRYASWSPTGQSICFGGRLITGELDPFAGLVAKARSLELPGASSGAYCVFRPSARSSVRSSGSPSGSSSGGMAAVVDEGTLFVYSGIKQSGDPVMQETVGADTHTKVMLLRELLSEGLIKRKEYDMRLERLTGTEVVR